MRPEDFVENELKDLCDRCGDVRIWCSEVKETRHGAERRTAEKAAVAELVRRAMGDRAVLRHKSSGAPYIEGREGVWISVSHCRGYAFLAVSTKGATGIDAEPEDERLTRVIERVMSEEERGEYDGSPEAAAKVWTAKEAAFKAMGIDGLTIGEIAVSGGRATARGVSVRLTHLCVGNMHIAVAIGAEE